MQTNPFIIGGAACLTSAARTSQAITRGLNTELQLCGKFLYALSRGDGQIYCPKMPIQLPLLSLCTYVTGLYTIYWSFGLAPSPVTLQYISLQHNSLQNNYLQLAYTPLTGLSAWPLRL